MTSSASITIGGQRISRNDQPYVIAELGVNHDGDVQRAHRLVDAAKNAHADAIKLQCFEARALLSKVATLADYQTDGGERDPWSMLQRLELGADDMARVLHYAHERGLHAIVTIFSVEHVEAAAQLPWDAYKIASPDLINRPLIEALLPYDKPLLLSTGAATLDEVGEALAWVAAHQHLLMQCVSAYPTPDTQASLAGIAALQRITPFALGYSDHTASLDTGGFAVAAGARVLEKHLTHDRSAAGPDHAASLDPVQFSDYVWFARRAFSMLGPCEKRVLQIEREVRRGSRQSITAKSDLPAGHALREDDLTVKRPGTGLSPAQWREVIGQRLVQSVDADAPLTEAHFAAASPQAQPFAESLCHGS